MAATENAMKISSVFRSNARSDQLTSAHQPSMSFVQYWDDEGTGSEGEAMGLSSNTAPGR